MEGREKERNTKKQLNEEKGIRTEGERVKEGGKWENGWEKKRIKDREERKEIPRGGGAKRSEVLEERKGKKSLTLFRDGSDETFLVHQER